MRVKRVNRYYCDYCKKAGCSKYHMGRHEDGCTLNPKRNCGMCGRQGGIDWALGMLPYPTDCFYTDEFESVGIKEGWEDILRETIDQLMDILEYCPACMLAVLRRRGIAPYIRHLFDYKKAKESFWEAYNDEAQNYY